ncbi:MAG TPA: hypothetical protein VFR94_04330 [Nitrososphaeraceae archaeon]|nr:hypothetical protein [Nitrososphaeraceae archaeon]
MNPVLAVEHKVGSLPWSYRDLADAFIKFATQKPSPIHGPGLNNSVYFLGTNWDDPPKGQNRASVQVDHNARLFINPIIAIVSVEEHTNEFPANPTEKQIMGRTEDIINDSDAEITIRYEDGKTSDYGIGQLQRVQVPYRKRQQLEIGKGVWPKYPDGGKVNACWDGYFIACENLKIGKHEVELIADSPYFGKPGHRYHSSFTYDLTVR